MVIVIVMLLFAESSATGQASRQAKNSPGGIRRKPHPADHST
jgi:hypothetical protein